MNRQTIVLKKMWDGHPCRRSIAKGTWKFSRTLSLAYLDVPWKPYGTEGQSTRFPYYRVQLSRPSTSDPSMSPSGVAVCTSYSRFFSAEECPIFQTVFIRKQLSLINLYNRLLGLSTVGHRTGARPISPCYAPTWKKNSFYPSRCLRTSSVSIPLSP